MSGKQSLSERLTNLSNSKSYVFLGRGGSGSATASGVSDKRNKRSNSYRGNRSSVLSTTTISTTPKINLEREDFLIFELIFHPCDNEDTETETALRDPYSDYSIRYHHWTLRQLYRHVVSSIKIRSPENGGNSGGNASGNGIISPKSSANHQGLWTTQEEPGGALFREEAPSGRRRSLSVSALSNTASDSTSDNPANPNNSDQPSGGNRSHRRTHSSSTNPRPNHHHRRQHSSNLDYHHHHHHHNATPKLLGSNLHPRDMRRLVTPFSASNEPELIVRRHVMVFNFDPLRAIITRDRLLVLVPTGADSILKKLEERIVGNRFEYEDYVVEEEEEPTPENTATEGSSQAYDEDVEDNTAINNDCNITTTNDVESGVRDEWGSEHGNRPEEHPLSDEPAFPENESDDDDDWSRMELMDQQKDLTFELLCVNACLSTVFEMLADDTEELQERGLKYVQNRIIGSSDSGKQLRPEDALAVIRNLKNAVQVMQARVKGFVQSISRILNEDEDMALMNVSRLVTNPENFVQPVSSEMLEIESDEPELVLESNLNNALTLSNALDLIQGQVETASDLIDARMDATRNKFLLASLCMSIASLSLTAMTCVGGVFGMNLRTGFEETPTMFLKVTYGSVFGSLLLGIAIFVGMIRTGVITGMGPVDKEGIDSLF
mmetsp:Transcript_12936/g.36456  ORF Transcript_12936/g.36456 Transcript_12936/m.36456 type:complete len:664 (+) Transcript_12936:183-2174(+)